MNDNANLSFAETDATTCSRQRLSDVIRAHLAVFLELDSPDDVGPGDAFADLGTDSRQAVEFKILLEELFQCRLRTTILFEHPSVDLLVEFLFRKILAGDATFELDDSRSLQEGAANSNQPASPTRTFETRTTYPLSETQKGLWYISQTLDCETSFNVPLLFRLAEPLDAPRFNLALRSVAQRHPVMCVHFRVQDDAGQVHQEVLPADAIPSVQQLCPRSDQSLHDQFWQKLRTPISLTEVPPLRAYYGQDDDGQQYCLIVFHHIVLDGLSAVPFSAELWQTYESHDARSDQTVLQPPLDCKFWEYLDWEANYLKSASSQADAEYWQAKLCCANQHVELLRTSSSPESGVDCVVQPLPTSTTAALNRLSRQLHAPRSTILLAAFHALLYRLSGNNVITVTTPVSGRPGGNQGAWKDAFGCFINLMMTSSTVDSTATFASLVEQVRQDFLEGLEHSQLPLARQFQSIHTSLMRDRNNPFPISFTYQNIFSAWSSSHHWQSQAEFDFSIYQEIQDDLTLEVYDFGDDLRLNWKLQRKCFARDAIECWSQAFENLLTQFLQNPKAKIGEIGLVDASSIDRLRTTNDKRGGQFTRYANVVDWIDAIARERQSASAIVCGNTSYSYGWLIDESHRIAAEIKSLPDYRPGLIVPVTAERTPQVLARILGILRSGCAYMPIDSDAPSERLRWMLEDVVGQCIPGMAYVLFTSGTTGRPKAVPIGHTALVNLCHAMIAAYALSSNDRVLQFAQLTFDMSIEEIFPTLCAGACVVLRDEEDLQVDRFDSLVVRHAVSVLNLPPSYHQALNTLGQALRQRLYAGVRLIAFGGDKLPLTTLREAQASGVRVFNAYGPTEACVNCALAELTEASSIHIGKAIDGAALLILNEHHQLVPAYCCGELSILGCGLSDGYLGIPDQSDKFVDIGDPFTGDQVRAYLTGDQAYYDAQGNIHLLGRSDDQLSLRGHRIEPGEVEVALESHPEVQAAAVALNQQQLVSWYTSGRPLASSELREHLSHRLPAIMIPSRFCHISALPLNGRGKLDRSKLAELALADAEYASTCPVFTSQQQEVFKVVEAILRETLQLTAIEPLATFWAIGGHSLLAIQVVTLLKQELRIDLSLKEFMRAATFYDLVVQLAARRQEIAGTYTADESSAAAGRTNQLSAGQKRLWFLDQLGQTRAYKIPALAEVVGPLDVSRLIKAMERIVARHEILRTNFVPTQDGPMCIVHPQRAAPLARRHFDGPESARKWIDEQVDEPFDLANDSLIRVSLATFEKERGWLLICLHHIVTDGWSMRILVNELQHFYSSPDDDRPDPNWQYQTCTDKIAQASHADALAYWRKQLQDLDDSELITELPRPPVLSDRGDTIESVIDAHLNSNVASFCRRVHITPAAFWLGCLSMVLYKRRTGEDICIGLPVAGRPHAYMSNVIGFFVNTVVIRIQHDLQRNASVEEYFQAVASTVYEALEHQVLPIESIFEMIMPDRRTDRSPVFQVFFSYAPETLEKIPLGDCELRTSYPKSDTAKFELTVSINERSDGSATLFVEYATDLFSSATARTLAGQLRSIADQAVQHSRVPLSQLQLISGTSRASNIQALPYKEVRPFGDAFRNQVQARPESTALESPQQSVTYRELGRLVDEQIVRIAGETGPIAILPTRSIELIVQCIAALQLGRPIAFDDRLSGQSIDLSKCAWLLPTSGTTGLAKSVAVSALGMDAHNQAFAELIDLTAQDRVAQYATPEFDLFIEEVFPALRIGATVVIVPDEVRLDPVALAHWIAESGVTILDLPTAVFHALAANDDALSQLSPQLRTIIVGGEQLSAERARRLVARHPQLALWNTYGPTEATVICSAHRFDPLQDIEDVPLGQPLGDAELLVVDPDGQPVPPGTAGELVIAGSGVALGYVSNGQLIGGLGFRPHPHQPNTRVYWTGDLVRYGFDGRLFFLGRTDDEVKIRGQRVRLLELQQTIKANHHIQDAAVVASNHQGKSELIAAVVTDADLSELRREVSAALPAALRPTTWLKFARIPVNRRGKVDRQRILDQALNQPHDSLPSDPITDAVTTRVLRIWRELLRTDQLQVDDDFFLVGGHSLLAVELIGRINQEFSADLSVLDAFRYPTVSALARHLKETNSLQPDSVTPAGSLARYYSGPHEVKHAIIIMPGLPGIGEFYHSLAKTLSQASPVVVLSMPGISVGEPAKSLGQFADIWSTPLQSLLAEHAIEKCTYVAHSYSASILVELMRLQQANLPETNRLILVDAWPHQQQSQTSRSRQWAQLLDAPHLQFARPVVESALAADSLVAGRLADADIDLVIAQDSQEWLSQAHWEPWFDKVRCHVVPGNHLSLVQSPHFDSWIALLGLSTST